MEFVMLKTTGLSMSFGTDQDLRVIFSGVDIEIQRGEIVSLVGPSGVGKSTLLRCLAGLLEPTQGRVELDSQPVDGPPEGLSVVFQDYSRSLMPWSRVLENVMLPLLDRAMPRSEKVERSVAALVAVGLEDVEHKYPWQLSGGMQQRVAIARSIAQRPDYLLMDEPFASVDAQTRADLEDLTIHIRDEFGMAIVVVTHDIDESVYLSDRVLVLNGRPATVSEIIQVGLSHPRDQILTKSENEFVSLRTRVLGLIRHGNPVNARIEGGVEGAPLLTAMTVANKM